MEKDQIVQQPAQLADERAEYAAQPQEILSTAVVSASTEARSTNGAGYAPTDLMEKVEQSVQLLVSEMQTLRHDFETKVKYDESKERQVDSLHRELQAYREGLHFKILRPVLIDLIGMHDDLGKLIERACAEASIEAVERMIANLESFQDTIEETLKRNGAEPFNIDGIAFVPNKQRALQTLDTLDPIQDRQVARRLRKGFEYDGKIVRPELVVIYRVIPGK